MKAPETASQVKLMMNVRGDFEKYIGRTATGPKRWRFGRDEATAQVQALAVWQRWEARPVGFSTWEQLDELEANKRHGERVAEQWQEEQAIKEARQKEEIDAAVATAMGRQAPVKMTVQEAKEQYLKGLEKRIGLTGSLGLEEWSVSQLTHKLNRALAFLPPHATMQELTYPTLETLIYTLAARPHKLANPKAKSETKEKQVKEQVSQKTALGWIQEVKAFLYWCNEEDSVGFTLPKHASKLFRIRPEADDQNIITISQEQLTKLWAGSVNQNAHTGDKGKIRRLWIMCGLNFGFYGCDISTITAEHIKEENGDFYMWKRRRRTRKSNTKVTRTKWYIWKETADLLKEYMPLKTTPNQIRLAFNRIKTTQKLSGISHSNLRDTGAMFMEKIGGRELADTYLAHARKGVIDSYSSPDWETLTKALKRFYDEFVLPAITGETK